MNEVINHYDLLIVTEKQGAIDIVIKLLKSNKKFIISATKNGCVN